MPVRGGDRRTATSASSTSCPSRSTTRDSTPRSRSASTSGRASRISPRGSARCEQIQQARQRAGSRIALVGKYVHLRDSYKSLHEALVHGGLDQRRAGRHRPTSTAEELTARQRRRERLGRHDAHPRARAASATAAPRARSRRSATRARTASPSSASASACRWRWSSTPATSAGSRAANSVEFDPDSPNPVDRPDARAAWREGQGRHHAPRRLSLRPRAGLARGAASTAAARSASVIVTASRSTTTTGTSSKRAGIGALRAQPRRAAWSRWWSSPSTRTSSAASSTRSSRAAPTSRTRSSRRFVKAALVRRDLRSSESEESPEQADSNMVH